MQAYRIASWKRIGEIDKGGKAAGMNTSERNLRRKRPEYVRVYLTYHAIEPIHRRLAKKAFSIGKMMDMACLGLYHMLFNLAGAWDDPKKRGWILDDLGRPMDAYAIAEHFEIRDKEHVAAALDLLCDPEIGLIELAEYESSEDKSKKSGGRRGKAGGVQVNPGVEQVDAGGKLVNAFKNVTVTEEQVKLTETEDGGVPGETIAPAAPHHSDTVAGSASQISVSASVKVPRDGGQQDVKARNMFLLNLTQLIKPRNQSDATTFRHIAEHLDLRMLTETDLSLYELALEKAVEAIDVGGKPIAMFVEAMKQKPFYYVPHGTSVIRGRNDRYRRKTK